MKIYINGEGYNSLKKKEQKRLRELIEKMVIIKEDRHPDYVVYYDNMGSPLRHTKVYAELGLCSTKYTQHLADKIEDDSIAYRNEQSHRKLENLRQSLDLKETE